MENGVNREDNSSHTRLSWEKYVEFGHHFGDRYIGDNVSWEDVDRVCRMHADYMIALKDLMMTSEKK